jgi:G3E family GTPase
VAGHFSSLLDSADVPTSERIPVTVLTGFLGSGKTTLLNRLLRQPDMHGTAVIVNEFGEVGIDHDLIAQTTDDTVLLANGCMCCAVRGDLVGALTRLGDREGPTLRQVLIETSGLADPGPILRTLMGEPAVRRRFVLAGVACTVDAVLAMDTLDRHEESVRQVAVADHLFLTKTDLLDGAHPPQALLDRLRSISPRAAMHIESSRQPEVLLELMKTRPGNASELSSDSPWFRTMGNDPVPTEDASTRHRDGISSFVLIRDEPLPRDAFAAWMDMVIAMRGQDLLRVKGFVQLAEHPDQPLVIHGVQHLFHPPETLPSWPGPDRRTRIVFITRGVNAQALGETLDVLVRRHMRRGVASRAAS